MEQMRAAPRLDAVDAQVLHAVPNALRGRAGGCRADETQADNDLPPRRLRLLAQAPEPPLRETRRRMFGGFCGTVVQPEGV